MARVAFEGSPEPEEEGKDIFNRPTVTVRVTHRSHLCPSFPSNFSISLIPPFVRPYFCPSDLVHLSVTNSLAISVVPFPVIFHSCSDGKSWLLSERMEFDLSYPVKYFVTALGIPFPTDHSCFCTPFLFYICSRNDFVPFPSIRPSNRREIWRVVRVRFSIGSILVSTFHEFSLGKVFNWLFIACSFGRPFFHFFFFDEPEGIEKKKLKSSEMEESTLLIF